MWSSKYQTLVQLTRWRGIRGYSTPHVYQSLVAVGVAPFKTPRSCMSIRVACVIDQRGDKWGRALLEVGIIIVSGCVAVRKGTMLKCCNSWLVGSDHPNHARSG